MLKFCNNYPSDVWICILWYHPNCSDNGDPLGDWEKEGWWHLAQGECAVVFEGDLHNVNRYWYYFAHAADGAFWAGVPSISVPHEAFDWCVNIGQTGARTVGLRELDVGDNDDLTVNLGP